MVQLLPIPWRWTTFIVIAVLVASLPSSVFAQDPLNLTIHYIQAVPDSTDAAYKVDAFVSVLNDIGDPVQNLDISSFTLYEDSQPLKVVEVLKASDVPVSLILVIDTSESMSTDGLVKAKRAATKFIQKLAPQDQVAIIGFNTLVGPTGEFTSDFQSAQNQLNSLKSISGSGSCLYDAAYKSLELGNTLAPGRRAIILLTDGKDETFDGRMCSSYKADDVINLANGNSGNIPVYTIGLGKDIDENTLKRMADLTGGNYLFSTDTLQLDALFDKLYQQFKEQYKINYISAALPGPHKLTVEVAIGAARDQSTRTFSLPNLPTRIQVVSPDAGGTFSSQVEISAQIIGEKENVKSVRFETAGQIVSVIENEPYTLVLDLSKFPKGNMDISVVALNGENVEIARDKINIIVGEINAPSSSPGSPIPTSEKTPDVITWNGLTIIILISVAAIVIIGLTIFLVLRRKKEPAPLAWDGGSDHIEPTLVGFEMESNQKDETASLTVIFSDDSGLIGKKFPLHKQTIKIGRDKLANDIVFENDRPVSREHVTLTLDNKGQFILEEVMHRKSGQLVGPTYGTFVNENKLQEAIAIFDGDQIRLGNRLKLLFTVPPVEDDLGESTVDDMDQPIDTIEENQ